jgi:uncharacterized repeat protein (TIGR03803 family)
MKSKRISSILSAALALVAITFSLAVSALAQTESILFSFGDNGGGWGPVSLSADSSGNLYGTGGIGNGMVYKLTPATYEWKESALHFFFGTDFGANPSSPVIFDAQGNLYGSTYFGGKSGQCPSSGCLGVVYELSPPVTGTKWTIAVLHIFAGGAGGAYPIGLVSDAAGNIYGMTQSGGSSAGICANVSGCGTVFRLSPQAGGGWQFTRIHTFMGNDGLQPQGSLVLDAAGNLYGTTSWGGNSAYCTQQAFGGCGVVFRLAPNSTGGWTSTTLHGFSDRADGASPGSQIVFDAAGNLYGTTNLGPSSAQYGVAFELTPTASGPWTFTPIYNFNNLADGNTTVAGLVIDNAGNLYGSSPWGGGTCNCGTVYKLSPGASGWSLTVLHTFVGNPDGVNPWGSLLLTSSGNLMGVTYLGGTYQGGTFYEITP